MEEEDWVTVSKSAALMRFIAIADPYLSTLVIERTDDPIPDDADFAFAHSALKHKFRRRLP
jgi:hypothetical protein